MDLADFDDLSASPPGELQASWRDGDDPLGAVLDMVDAVWPVSENAARVGVDVLARSARVIGNCLEAG